jgi:hypothetical protein
VREALYRCTAREMILQEVCIAPISEQKSPLPGLTRSDAAKKFVSVVGCFTLASLNPENAAMPTCGWPNHRHPDRPSRWGAGVEIARLGRGNVTSFGGPYDTKSH